MQDQPAADREETVRAEPRQATLPSCSLFGVNHMKDKEFISYLFCKTLVLSGAFRCPLPDLLAKPSPDKGSYLKIPLMFL
ncbi:hypothetical protein JKI59_003237 [Salmonella enterica]|nr:hypothetical protein [Salmonella enterica]